MSESKSSERGFAQVYGTSLAYEVAGEGHPLVLIHGGLMDQSMWDDQFDVFAQQYRVVRFDLRGFGQSSIPAPGDQLSFHEDLFGLLTFLGIEKTYVLGLSMGGSTALDFTLAHPSMVDALVLVAPGMSGYNSSFSDAEETMGQQIELASNRGDYELATELETRMWVDGPDRKPEQVDPLVRKRVYEMNLRNYQRLGDLQVPMPQRLDPPASERLDEVKVPTLLIIGDKDVRGMFPIIDLLAQGVPNARKVIMPGVAHVPNMEQPQEFNRIVLDFLASAAL